MAGLKKSINGTCSFDGTGVVLFRSDFSSAGSRLGARSRIGTNRANLIYLGRILGESLSKRTPIGDDEDGWGFALYFGEAGNFDESSAIFANHGGFAVAAATRKRPRC